MAGGDEAQVPRACDVAMRQRRHVAQHPAPIADADLPVDRLEQVEHVGPDGDGSYVPLGAGDQQRKRLLPRQRRVVVEARPPGVGHRACPHGVVGQRVDVDEQSV
ncbi:MAG: hypothetical protein ACK55I_12795, partial [bacterium]